MSLQTIIVMFVTCMAPLFLVYFVVDGIYMLQLDKTTYVSEKPKFDGPTKFKAYIVLCVAFVVTCAVLSIYTAIFCGRKRAEEPARRKTRCGNVGQRDDGGMEWFDIDLRRNDSEVGDEEAKRSYFVHVDEHVSDVSLDSGSKKDNIGKKSLGSASGSGWCVLT